MAEISGYACLMDDPAYRASLQRLYDAFPHWDALAGKTLLISGASGMIGSFLIDALMLRNEALPAASRIRIIGLARNERTARERFAVWKEYSELSFFSHDIQNPLPDIPEKVDYILHAASTTHPRDYAAHPIDTIMTNLLGTKNLLEFAASQANSRFLLLSSVEIYGENRGDTERFHEAYCGYLDCNTLRAGYPEGKRVSEALCQAYIEEKGVDAVILRLPRCYGPTMRMSDTKSISQFIKNSASGTDIVLKSEGKQLYSYAHVCDAVQGLLWVLLCGNKGEAYNLGDSASDITLRDLAGLCATCAGTRVIYSLPEQAEQKGYSTASKALMDGNKLKAMGWQPQYGIADGIPETISIIKAQQRS